MKKILMAVSTTGLIVALSTQAAVPTGAAPFQVIVPNLKSGLEFTVEGLYLQPTNSDLDYVTQTTFLSNTTNTTISTLDPDYDFGFRLGIGYVFPNSGNDVQLSWTYFNHNDTASSTLTGGDVFSRAGAFIASGFETTTATSDVGFNYNAVDLDVGQYVSIGTRLQTRLFAGLRYAQVKNDITDTYDVTSGAQEVRADPQYETYDSKFTGIGPRLGVDTQYHVGNCFGVVGQVAVALLVGRVEAGTEIVNVAPDGFTSSLTISADNQTRVVPAVDAKLGINYSWPIHNDAQRFTIEAGYQVTQYIDAIDRLSPSGAVPVDVSVNQIVSRNVSRTTSSIGFNGPYLSLNYKI